jgi:predicted nucleotidyltransferase
MGWDARNGVILFKSVRGSHLFGLNTEESDLDTFGLFCCPQRWLLGTGEDYKPYLSDE